MCIAFCCFIQMLRYDTDPRLTGGGGDTPIHESSAFQLFIFHIYILSFSFFVIIRNLEKAVTYILYRSLEKVKSINECMCTSNLLD